MRSDELHEFIDLLSDERITLESSFEALQERILSGKHLSAKEYERLCDLENEAANLKEDVEHHLLRCIDECDPNEIADEKKRLEHLRKDTEN